MIELVLLIAIAYAGARGVESIAGTSDHRHDTAEARRTVEKIAVSGPGDSGKKPPAPTERGGTFSAVAPRSAKAGGKAAVPLAVLTETGSTMWKASLEGYRERWPEIRAERRRKMAEKAARKKEERAAAEAKKTADEALAKAGPPPSHPPAPAEPPAAPDAASSPDTADDAEPPAVTIPGPRDPDRERADAAEARAAEAEKKAEQARREAEEAKERAAQDKVLAAQKEAREAKEREASAEERARVAEERAAAAQNTTTDPAGRRHLSVVPDTGQNGDPMSSPSLVIPEIRTLDGLMNALTLTKAMCEMRAEEALAIASDDQQLSNRLDQLEAELAELEVDDKTRGEISELRESIQVQSQTAAQYGAAAKDAGDFAVAAAAAAYKSHGGIAEAVQSSPIEKAAQAGYYEH